MNLNNMKWLGTSILILSVGFNSIGLYPVGPLLQIVGGSIWFYCSIRMNDKPLMITNGFMSIIGISGLLYTHFMV